jgi:hypothetical protein
MMRYFSVKLCKLNSIYSNIRAAAGSVAGSGTGSGAFENYTTLHRGRFRENWDVLRACK